VISVVITAHNRHEFLLKSVKSVLNQTIRNFEVIVVKNFYDDTIDKFLEENNVINIIEKDYRQGAKIFKGVKEAKYDIIAFLDDDDMFHERKLEKVSNVIKFAKDLIYYHNNFTTINDMDRPIHNPYLLVDKYEFKIFSNNEKIKYINYFDKFHINVNSSSIVINKNIVLSHNIIKELENLIDYGLFFSAIDDKGSVVVDGEPLTYYRLHDLQTNIGGSLISKDKFIENYANILERKIRSINLLCKYFKHNPLIYEFCDKKRMIFYLLYNSLPSKYIKKEYRLSFSNLIKALHKSSYIFVLEDLLPDFLKFKINEIRYKRELKRRRELK